MQLAAQQVPASPLHAAPQAPQLSASACSLTQPASQLLQRGAQQMPSRQSGVSGLQASPQAPQLLLSLGRSAQYPPLGLEQLLKPVLQVSSQTPPLQMVPQAHATPPSPAQPPQFFGSLDGSLQSPLQRN